MHSTNYLGFITAYKWVINLKSNNFVDRYIKLVEKLHFIVEFHLRMSIVKKESSSYQLAKI